MGRLALVFALIAGCGRLGFEDLRTAPDAADPMDPTLRVSVEVDRMAGPPTLSSLDQLSPGTLGLSLREALTIATNRAGPDRIVFDPGVFAPTTPVTVALGSTLVLGDDATTLDATGAGVVLGPGAGFSGALLRVTGNGDELIGLTLQQGDIGISALGVTGLAIRLVHALDTVGEAVRLENVAQVTVEDSRIDHAGPAPIHIITSTDTIVQRTFVALAAKTGTVYGVRVEGSQRIHVVDCTIDPGTAWMISLDASSDNEVIGNIVDGGDTGITLTGGSNRNHLFRNVVMAPNTDSVYVDGQSNDNIVENNTFYMIADITDEGVNTVARNNLVSANVTDFVAPAGYDFHLVAGSASIDAATDVAQDMLPDAPARFLGAAPDLGAVESY